ncbi:MAG: hypothetical protein PHQ50_04820, partial [Eubacteriales bacterium]|nr:hypothetical protein [Eubacteriales bacterium]
MKRIVSLMVALCMILAPTFSVMAGTDESASLEKAILAVKQVVTVPADYTEFSHYSYTSDTENDSELIWNLTWQKPEDYASISATVDSAGNIMSLYQYKNDEDQQGLAKVTRAQAEVKAKEFLKKVYPKMASDMREINRKDNILFSYDHYFEFALYANDLKVSFIKVSLSVNKYNGEISSFNGLTEGFSLPVLPTKTGAITKDAAVAAYLEKLGFELSYQSFYDYETQTLEIFPAYQISSSSKFVDAMTGEIVDAYYNGNIYYGGSMDESKGKEMGGFGGMELTEEEIAEIVKVSSLLSKSEAVAKIKALAPSNPGADYTVESASLTQQYTDPEVYIWNISFKDIYANVNAKTGELLSYSYYTDVTGNQNNTEEECKRIAEAYLKRIMPEKFANCEFSENQNIYSIYKTEELPSSYSFKYDRVENGMTFSQNGLYVDVDRKSGRIQYYNCEWYENAEFPIVTGAIAKEKLMELADKTGKYGLMYQQVGEKGDVKLVYGFTETLCSLFDPLNGGCLDWEGKPYQVVVRPEYTDIKGHFCEMQVKVLLENGYYIKGNLFKPDAKITQADFFRYLYSNTYTDYDETELYEMLESIDLIEKAEIAPKSLLTRQDAAKFAVRYLGLGLAGEHPEIFTTTFKDKVANEYKGYAALVNGL